MKYREVRAPKPRVEKVVAKALREEESTLRDRLTDWDLTSLDLAILEREAPWSSTWT